MSPSFALKLAKLVAVVAVTVLVATAVAVHAESPPPAPYAERLEAFMRTQMQQYNIPGAAVAIVRQGEVEHLAGYGTANAAGDPVTSDTPFLLASVSKSFTALGVMQLVEQGRIELDAPVRRYLPWFDVAGGQGGDITVAQLLYQTSGFSELAGVQANLLPDSPDALEDGVRDLATEELAFPPGDDWQYSNLNYNVLGLLVQEVSGLDFGTYVQEHIFDPLQMTHSFTSLAAARAAGGASGYYPFFGVPLLYDEYMPYSRAILPAGGLWSSASDMSHYLIAHLSGGRYAHATILSEAGTAELHQAGFEWEPGSGYAMGWTRNAGFLDREFLQSLETDLKAYDHIPIVFHEGDAANYYAMAFLLPEQDFGVAILMNINDPTVDSALNGFAWDATLLANGGEPQYFPPWRESFVVRHSRWVFAVVVLLLILELVWSARKLRRMRGDGYATEPTSRTMLLYAGLPLLLDVVLVGAVLLFLLPGLAVDLPVMIRYAPDVGLLVVLMLWLAAGWGLARTLLFATAWRRRRRATPVEPAVMPAGANG